MHVYKKQKKKSYFLKRFLKRMQTCYFFLFFFTSNIFKHAQNVHHFVLFFQSYDVFLLFLCVCACVIVDNILLLYSEY